jgi:WD40 repeat protein
MPETGTVRLFEGANLRTPKWSTAAVANVMRFSPDGSLLTLGLDRPGGVQLHKVESGRRVTTFSTGGPIRALAFAADGRTLAAAGQERIIHFWDLEAGEPLGGLQGHLGTVTSLAFSPDGNLLASGGADGLVRLWYWRDLLQVM